MIRRQCRFHSQIQLNHTSKLEYGIGAFAIHHHTNHTKMIMNSTDTSNYGVSLYHDVYLWRCASENFAPEAATSPFVATNATSDARNFIPENQTNSSATKSTRSNYFESIHDECDSEQVDDDFEHDHLGCDEPSVNNDLSEPAHFSTKRPCNMFEEYGDENYDHHEALVSSIAGQLILSDKRSEHGTSSPTDIISLFDEHDDWMD